jgi:hypothetical protein
VSRALDDVVDVEDVVDVLAAVETDVIVDMVTPRPFPRTLRRRGVVADSCQGDELASILIRTKAIFRARQNELAGTFPVAGRDRNLLF